MSKGRLAALGVRQTQRMQSAQMTRERQAHSCLWEFQQPGFRNARWYQSIHAVSDATGAHEHGRSYPLADCNQAACQKRHGLFSAPLTRQNDPGGFAPLGTGATHEVEPTFGTWRWRQSAQPIASVGRLLSHSPAWPFPFSPQPFVDLNSRRGQDLARLGIGRDALKRILHYRPAYDPMNVRGSLRVLLESQRTFQKLTP